MSGQEARAIQAAALLEFEDAKADLALLRAKAQQWVALQDKVAALLVRAKNASYDPPSVAQARAEVSILRVSITAAMDLQAILQLDLELEQAVERFKRAEAAKKSLGFN